MNELINLTKRNIKVFLRDKVSVFFSFLSVIILLALYFLFIGKQYISGSEFDGLSSNLKNYLGISIIMGGVLVINTLSLSLGVNGVIVNDIETRKLDGFMVSPVKRYKVILAYFISSIIVTAVLTLIMWFLTILYVFITTKYLYSFKTILNASLLLILFTFISSSIMIFIVTLVKSQNAFGTIAGILGTVVGFISGIYMPLFILGSGVSKVSSLVPFTHMTILLKQVILSDPYSKLAPEFVSALHKPYGTENIGILGFEVSMTLIIIFCIILSMILLVLSYFNLNKKMVK